MSRRYPAARVLAIATALLGWGGASGCKSSDDYYRVRDQDRHRDGGALDGGALGDGGDGGGATGPGSDGGNASGRGGTGGPGNPGDGGGSGMDGGLYIFDGSVRLPNGSELLADGAIELPDGEVIDPTTAQVRYGEEVDIQDCAMSELDQWQTPVSFGDEGGFSLAAGALDGFALAYRAQTTGNCSQNVNLAHLSSLGGLPMPSSVLPDCKVIRDVAVYDGRETGYLAWVDNYELTAELQTLPLGAGLSPPATFERTRITTSESDMEMKPVIGEVGDAVLLAWIVDDAATGERGVLGKILGSSAEPFEILPKSTAHAPNGLAITPLGSDGTAAVAWVGAQSMPGVWLQPLGADAHPVGEPVQLTDRVGASSSVSLGWRRDGGGVAYSIVIDGIPQVRFRRLDALGATVGDERSVVGPPMRAQDASIAAIGGGYIMVYRLLPSASQPAAEIRMQFLTREGTLFRDASGRASSFLIAEATVANGRTSVAVALDGQLMISWIDGDPDGDANLLKVVRRRLTCAL